MNVECEAQSKIISVPPKLRHLCLPAGGQNQKKRNVSDRLSERIR